MFNNLCYRPLLQLSVKKKQWLLGQNIGEKVFNHKLQILLLYLEHHVCRLFILLTCISVWSYLRNVVSLCKKRIRLGWGVVRLSERRYFHYPHILIYDHRGGGWLARKISCFQYNNWYRYNHEYFFRWCKMTAFIPY